MTALAKENAAMGSRGVVGKAEKTAPEFYRVSSLRERRLLEALLGGSMSREALDRASGASNSPDVVFRLRGKGFDLPCELREGLDRDGRPCKYGVYRLSGSDADLAVRALMQGE